MRAQWPKVRTWLGVTLVALAVAGVTVSGLEQIHQRQVTACQVRFNQTYARIVRFRAELADRDRAATLGLITTVFSLPQGPRGERLAQAAFRRYQRTEQQVSRSRAAHRFPPPPEQCR